MDIGDIQDIRPEDADGFEVLRKNRGSAQKVIHSLLNGKHIDHFLSEEFRFIENYPSVWEDFFHWLGYRLRRSDLGGSPFYYLESRSDLIGEARLSRGATFLGLYTAWHFFMQGPGEPDRISAEEIFKRLVSSYPFAFLRAVFFRKVSPISQTELNDEQTEKLRANMRRDLSELSRYRFIDVRPNARAHWDDLMVHRLPALYRFWELALHVHATSGNGQEANIDQVVAEVWGSLDPEPDEDAQ